MYGALELMMVKSYVTQFMGKGKSLPIGRVQSVDTNYRHVVANMCQPGELGVQGSVFYAYAEELCYTLDPNG